MEEQPKVESYTAGVPQEGQEADPKMAKQVEGYISVLNELLHSEKSRDSVTDVLTSNPDPFMTLPQAAVSTNDMGVNLMQQSGVKVSFATQLAASTYLIEDLIHLGYAAAGWENLSEEDIAALYEDTLQIVIERGLADGSIDPIQLQLDVEPLMDEDMQRAGQHFADQEGLGSEPSNQAMVGQYANVQEQKTAQTQAKSGAKQKAIKGREVGNEMAGRAA